MVLIMYTTFIFRETVKELKNSLSLRIAALAGKFYQDSHS